MLLTVNKVNLNIVTGDITSFDVDCLVNPANSSLILGDGIAGKIRKIGGKKIQEECNSIGFCPLGHAVITKGGDLGANFIIHAVGPRYNIDPEPKKNLRASVINSLKLAQSKGFHSIALPAISTGIFGYPLGEASYIIIRAIIDFSKEDTGRLKTILLCLFSENSYRIFGNTAKILLSK